MTGKWPEMAAMASLMIGGLMIGGLVIAQPVQAMDNPEEAAARAALVVLSIDGLSGQCTGSDGAALAQWSQANGVPAFRPRIAALRRDPQLAGQLDQGVALIVSAAAASGQSPCAAALALARANDGQLGLDAMASSAAAAAAPARASTPSARGGPQGAATRSLAALIDSFGFDTRPKMGIGGFMALDIYPVVLMKDGSALTDIELLAQGGAGADGRTRWRRAGGKIELLKQGAWKALPFSRTYSVLPAGFRLDGHFQRLSGVGNVAMGGSQSVAAVDEYAFARDGSVVAGGSLGSSGAAGDTTVATFGRAAGRAGRYRIDGLMLTIDWNDGAQESRIIVTDPDDPKSVIWLDGRGYTRKRG